MFFRRKKRPVPQPPDPSRACLYNGDPYDPDDGKNHASPYTYTLTEWSTDCDDAFPEFALECALTILDDHPIVINCLHPAHLGDTLRTDDKIQYYLKNAPHPDFGYHYNVVTMTNGPDRKLVDSFPHNNEFYHMVFYGFRLPHADAVPKGEQLPPDVVIGFFHYHCHLTITSEHGIDMYADKIRTVCEKYGKTLVLQELPSRAKESD